ncbi:MAG: NAD(P)-dependent alcohol dehydrogenase [Spirochaetota bacterium]
MQAVQIKRYGTKDTLEITEVDKPIAKANQVLIEIHSSSVNPIDWKLRNGSMKFLIPLSFPVVLGFDLSGVVVEVGKDVQKFKPGDAVYSRSNTKSGGTYAEYIALDESVVCHKPSNMPHEEAAAVPLAALTALQGMRDKGNLQSGQKVLINGASGGVGIYAIQIACAMGAEVVGVCSAANADLVKSLGASRIIDYKTENPIAEGIQYDQIFDAVASLDFSKAKKAMKPGATLITTVPNFSVIWGMLTNFFSSQKAEFIMVSSNGSDLQYLKGLAEEGKLKSIIDSTFSLTQIKDAHERSESGRVKGKVVVKVK